MITINIYDYENDAPIAVLRIDCEDISDADEHVAAWASSHGFSLEELDYREV
jgi:hypothetical protein